MKDEIAKDRAERAAREKKAKAESEAGSGATQVLQSTVSQPKKEYDSCRLQVITCVRVHVGVAHFFLLGHSHFVNMYMYKYSGSQPFNWF